MARQAGVVVATLLTASVAVAQLQFVQQGDKLVGSGAAGLADQGAVAISADGNTALLGGPVDHSPSGGAVWVFTRSGVSWTQQGNKLVADDEVGAADFGGTVAISSDGNTAIVGGLDDNSGIGAAWIFTRDGGVWSQRGGKLVGSGAVGNATQGTSVSMSANGDLAAIGGDQDHSAAGAAWVFAADFPPFGVIPVCAPALAATQPHARP